MLPARCRVTQGWVRAAGQQGAPAARLSHCGTRRCCGNTAHRTGLQCEREVSGRLQGLNPGHTERVLACPVAAAHEFVVGQLLRDLVHLRACGEGRGHSHETKLAGQGCASPPSRASQGPSCLRQACWARPCGGRAPPWPALPGRRPRQSPAAACPRPSSPGIRAMPSQDRTSCQAPVCSIPPLSAPACGPAVQPGTAAR